MARIGDFTLGSVSIDGATAFSPSDFSSEFEPYLATTVNADTLKAIAARITQRYRAAGFLLSYATIPAQNVSSGIVRIEVVEGCIDSLTIEGAGSQQQKLETIAAPLIKHGPLNSRALERVIGLMRTMPGIGVTDVRIRPVTNDPASNHLTISIERDRVQTLVYTDNRGTEAAGRQRFYTSASIASLITAGDELRLDLFGIPGHGYHYLYGQVVAKAPIGSNGWRVGVAASRGHQFQRLSGSRQTNGRLEGDSVNLSADLSYRLVQSRALTAVARISVNDWESLADFRDVRIQRDHLRVARIGMDVTAGGKSRIEAQFALSQGLSFDGVTRRRDPLASRGDGSGVFTKATANLLATKPITNRIVLRVAASGQYSNKPLLSAEEFALGGSSIGRAYDFNILTGDHGVSGGAEWAYRVGDLHPGAQQVEIFAFADGGAVFQSGTNSGEPRSQSLTSVGGGTRFALEGFSISSEIGVPLQRIEGMKSVRGYFSVARAF